MTSFLTSEDWRNAACHKMKATETQGLKSPVRCLMSTPGQGRALALTKPAPNQPTMKFLGFREHGGRALDTVGPGWGCPTTSRIAYYAKAT
jgi:hypothetical protein